MSVATIELTDEALLGVGPFFASTAEMEALPTTVRLGRIRPKAQASCLKLSSYLPAELDAGTGELSAAILPASTNRREKAAASAARMYLNDRYGCCVISGKAHGFGLWSANDTDSGGIVFATDQEILNQYHAFCGAGDNGCNIASVLDIIKSKGFVMGGKTYKIDGYVSVDNTKKELTKAALYIFGCLTLGIDLPQAWTSAAVWDVTNTRIVGGHDVTAVDFDEQGVYISSWGRIYLITWAAFLSQKWITELYAMLAPLWYGADGVTLIGMKVDVLKADLAKIASGIIPDIVDPVPPGPMPEANVIRILTDAKKGANGNFVLGSDLAAGEYDAILTGDGPPPLVP